MLRTDIFKHADDSLEYWDPSMDGYEWVPVDFSRWLLPLDSSHRGGSICRSDWGEVVTNAVYRHLVMWEDIYGINHGENVEKIDTWLARQFNNGPALWQTLMKDAITEKQLWNQPEYSIYPRPSLWFLRDDWMKDHHRNFKVERIPSMTFNNDEDPNTLFTYVKSLDVSRIIDLIEKNTISVSDIDGMPQKKTLDILYKLNM